MTRMPLTKLFEPLPRGKRKQSLGVLLAAIVASAGFASSAGAAVPFVDLGASGGPLTKVAIGSDLSCQVQHTGDSTLEFFPSTATPGDCGTFLAVGDTLFAPDFANHDRTATYSLGTFTPFTSGGQGARTGSGSGSNPYRVVTKASAAGMQLTETDAYIKGQESYRSDVTVLNGGSSAQPITLYRAADCYLQNTDIGYGFTGANNAVGCSANANNSPPNRIEEWVPITGGNNYLEHHFSDVWSAIGTHAAFPNLCAECTNSTDNGAGISWSTTLQPGQSTTYSHFTTFSPVGAAGPPPPPPPDVPTQVVVPPSAIGLPSSKKCVDRRHFKFKLHSPKGQKIVKTQVYINGKLKVTNSGKKLTKFDLRSLPKKTFVVKIVDTSDQGVLVISTRKYHGCKKSKPHTVVRRPHRKG